MDNQGSSSLSRDIQKTGNILRESASNQITDYKTRFQAIRDLFDKFLSDVIISDFNSTMAYETAIEFFGSNRVKFAAIDGTEYTQPMFDLVIFFSDACAAKGYIEFKENGPPKVEYLTGLARARARTLDNK